MKRALLPLLSLLAAAAAGIYLYTLPGMRRLPRQARARLDGILTLADAEAACRASGLAGWDLAAFAQQLAARKFSYSRRNPWDTPARAFERGMGYCLQQAMALGQLYCRLGIPAELVYTARGRFPGGVVHGMPEGERISGHTWLRVTLNGETRDVCPGRESNRPGRVHFEVLGEVRPLRAWMLPFAHLGSVVENARRDRAALKRAASLQSRAAD